MSIEDQIRQIAKDELSRHLEDVESRFQIDFKREKDDLKKEFQPFTEEIEGINTRLKEEIDSLSGSMRRENIKLKESIEDISGQLTGIEAILEDLTGRIEKLEEELNNRWSLLVKLRKYTLDQLMSEYKRLTGAMRSEPKEPIENAGT
jgi:chromosome segregation ATPase